MKKDIAPVKSTKAAKATTAAKASAAAPFKCACPYCDDELTVDKTPLFCAPCNLVVRYCKTCKKAAPQDSRVCPDCGGKLE